LQALARRLENLQQMHQQERNRLTSGERSALVTDSITIMLQALEIEIVRLEQFIREHIQQHPNLQAQHDLLTTISGIGDKTATTILAECGDLRAYPSARELAAYAGLTPKEFRSGSFGQRQTAPLQDRLVALAPSAVLPGDFGQTLQPDFSGLL
jgi:transposase